MLKVYRPKKVDKEMIYFSVSLYSMTPFTVYLS